MTMIRCQTCNAENPERAKFCQECGARISSAGGESDIAQPSMPTVMTSSSFRVPSVTSVGIPAVPEPVFPAEAASVEPLASVGEKSGHARLVIERGASVNTEFVLTADESNIGRWDPDNGIFPDIDLDTHDPDAKVSRRHARIIHRDGRHMIEDLGSTNGTFINRGRRLIPGSPSELSDGDEIIVGKTFLRFHKKH